MVNYISRQENTTVLPHRYV